MDSQTEPCPAMETQEERRIKLREHATKRLITELQHLVMDPPDEFSAGPIDEQDMLRWKATIMPKWESPYKGGVFFLKIQVPRDYPFTPPKVRFDTKIYHPNIDSATGEISMDVLGPKWCAKVSIQNLLVMVCDLLTNPVLENPLMPEIAHL